MVFPSVAAKVCTTPLSSGDGRAWMPLALKLIAKYGILRRSSLMTCDLLLGRTVLQFFREQSSSACCKIEKEEKRKKKIVSQDSRCRRRCYASVTLDSEAGSLLRVCNAFPPRGSITAKLVKSSFAMTQSSLIFISVLGAA